MVCLSSGSSNSRSLVIASVSTYQVAGLIFFDSGSRNNQFNPSFSTTNPRVLIFFIQPAGNRTRDRPSPRSQVTCLTHIQVPPLAPQFRRPSSGGAGNGHWCAQPEEHLAKLETFSRRRTRQNQGRTCVVCVITFINTNDILNVGISSTRSTTFNNFSVSQDVSDSPVDQERFPNNPMYVVYAAPLTPNTPPWPFLGSPMAAPQTGRVWVLVDSENVHRSVVLVRRGALLEGIGRETKPSWRSGSILVLRGQNLH